MVWKNNLTDILKIRYPIIQAPMLGITSPEMVSAVSNESGLGSLPIGGLSPEVSIQLIRKTKKLTNKPFAVNLFTHELPNYNERDLQSMKELLLSLAHQKGYTLGLQDLQSFKFYTYHDQVELLLQEKIKIISFTFGCLDHEAIRLFKKAGCILIGTATCLEEALFLRDQDIDMISVQGIEAGGHRGTFILHKQLPEIGLFSLLPQIAKHISLPCIAAGGINNGQTIKAAFELGATAVQIGTPFIGTDESEAIPSYKSTLEEVKDTGTSLTKAFSGKWARGIRNELMDKIEQSGIPIPPYPIQNSLTAKFRKLAQQANDHEYTNLWAGQSAGKTGPKKTKDVFLDLVRQYEGIV